MINAIPILPAVLALILSGYSTAGELTDAAQELCDTIKTCALEAAAGPDITDKLRQQMDPVLEKNCAQMRDRVQAVPTNHALHQLAVGCLSSMASLSCAELHDSGLFKTPECTEYDQRAKAAGAATP